MSYRYYDDYYYNPARERAMMKNMNLVWLGEEMKSSMCRVGQKKVKLFLNSLIKKGDAIAKMYRLILEAENHNINAKKYPNTSTRSYKDDYYERKREVIEELIKDVLEFNKANEQKIEFGIQDSDVSETVLIIYFDLPDCEQISFHTDISDELLNQIPEYEKEWDKKVNTTLPKIERAINKRYKDELYEKYKTEIDAYEEAKRLEEERIERIRRQNELEQKKERERVNALKSKIIDGIVWDDIRDYVQFKKDADIVKSCLTKLSNESRKKFKESYLNSIDVNLLDVREDNIDDLNSAIEKFYHLLFKTDADVLCLEKTTSLIDKLTAAVVKFNSGATCDTGNIRMFLKQGNHPRYMLDGLSGKYTLYFDSDKKPSKLSKKCYKIVSVKEAKKIGNPKMEIKCYLNVVENNKKRNN